MLIPVAFPGSQLLLNKHTILAGDIGATKTNLALYNSENLVAVKKARYKTTDFPDLAKMLTDFLASEKMPDVISLGVAGPISNGKVNFTNIGLEISSSQLSGHFNNVPVYLINDLEATAYGLAVLDKKDVFVVHDGVENIAGNIAIIAPGTGLGEAGMYHDGKVWHPFATEGGHCDFAPRTQIDIELFSYLHRKFGHLSWERLISGPGICNIYDFLVDEKEREVPAWITEKMLVHDQATVIGENAEECAVCKETIDLFLRYLAHESSNMVLKLKATGGLFIGGGIIPKLIHLMYKDVFLKWFCESGRMKSLLKNIQVRVILNDETALLGAAYYGMHSNQ